MHPGSLYSSFGSKESLCLEAIELYGQQSSQLFKECMKGQSFFDGLERYFERVVFDNQNPCTCFLAKTFSSQLSSDERLVEKARELVAEFRSYLADQIAEAQNDGVIKASQDCHAFASLIQTQIMGLRCLADSAPGEKVLHNAVRDVMGALRSSAAP